VETWIFFAFWLVLGLAIYFAYGQRHSRLNERFAEANASVNGTARTASVTDVESDDEDAMSRT